MPRLVNSRSETLTLATSVGFPQVRNIPPGMNHLDVEVPSSTLENISLMFTPKIAHIYHFDASSASPWIEWTKELTDRNTSSVAVLNSLATADFLYVGGVGRYRGYAIDVTATNSNNAVMTVQYWRGDAWTGVPATFSDGTISGSASLGADGVVTWGDIGPWAAAVLGDIVNGAPRHGLPLYWTRVSFDAALDATVTMVALTLLASQVVNAIDGSAVNRDYTLLQSNNRTLPPYRLSIDERRYGGLEMKSASITSAANLNWLNLR